jgi:hypothetical protein
MRCVTVGPDSAAERPEKHLRLVEPKTGFAAGNCDRPRLPDECPRSWRSSVGLASRLPLAGENSDWRATTNCREPARGVVPAGLRANRSPDEMQTSTNICWVRRKIVSSAATGHLT